MRSLEGWGLLGLALLLVVVLPALNALPAGAPLRVSDFTLNLFGKFLAYAILALGIDLIWGYTGVLSLGHGVFFGLGADFEMFFESGQNVKALRLTAGLTF